MAPNSSVLGTLMASDCHYASDRIFWSRCEYQGDIFEIEWAIHTSKRRDWRAKDDLYKMREVSESRHYSQHFVPFLSLTKHSIKILPILSLATFSRWYSLQTLNTFTVYPQPLKPDLNFPLLATNFPPSERVSLEHRDNPNICSVSISCTFPNLRHSTSHTVLN